ncbi:integral membrane protein 2Cb [Tachysurus fulvidraco]|uniref:integral membrane protein 2Cb n=1 Tax=Tachysurus fulvidraco TaxID=1234273 RepID=UPI000F4E9F2E|nr:integral membrane protein 2Cb [Tachysurus fulvidraco]
MVKISFQPVSVQKPEKQRDGGKEEIIMSYSQPDELVLPLRPKKSSISGLWCLIPGLVIFISGVIIVSVYVYRNYFTPQIPEDSLFHCRVMYEDSLYAPLLGRQELQENVGIYLDENYEQINVPVPNFGGSDPADIIHDFHRGLTAYHDIALDKCFVVELNTTIVMPPRNLWELLNNVKRGMYLPQTYMVQEEMMVTGRVKNMRQLGPFIHRLCYGKETFRLKRRNSRRRIDKRESRKCHRIRHFENTFVMETMICDRA